MSLYYEAAHIVQRIHEEGGSLKSRVFAHDAKLGSNPKQVYALISQASKWSTVLPEVIERASLLRHERKLSPTLGVLLVHDLLLSPSGVTASALHPLRVAVERHRARLQAELSRVRIAHGLATFEALQTHVEQVETHLGAGDWPHPRWVRVNRLRNTNLQDELNGRFGGLGEYQRVDSLREVLEACKATPHPPRLLYIDEHVPDLVAVPSITEILASKGHLDGRLIIQDKASCFPALLLDPQDGGGDILDACAAPGNKTTHLAALLRVSGTPGRIWACERDKQRAGTLRSMIAKAGAEEMVSILANQDFLKLNPSHSPARDVRAILLDPSCSGSGIIDRDEKLKFDLPKVEMDPLQPRALGKRKRNAAAQPTRTIRTLETDEVLAENTTQDALSTRLTSLSEIQVKMIMHAMSFPKARKIVYSTCSTYVDENESVVLQALTSSVAQSRGWRILNRDEQVTPLRDWVHRGQKEAFSSHSLSEFLADSCIRCLKNTEDGTQGFFVAGFVRDSTEHTGELNGFVPEERNVVLPDDDFEETWEGFGDE